MTAVKKLAAQPIIDFKADYFPCPARGYLDGFTQITTFDGDDTTLQVGFLTLKEEQDFSCDTTNETVFLLARGDVRVSVDGTETTFKRRDPFDDDPSTVHAPAGVGIKITADADSVFTIYEAQNTEPFPAEIYQPQDTVSVWFDNQAKPIAAPTGTPTDRRVRTVFDNSSDDKRVHTHPNARLTVGEVLSMPGCWSSWRPHHHQEPDLPRGYIEESYFYFTKAFGLSQMEGQSWREVRNHDLVLHRGNNHAQAASPDAPVCYAWVIYTPPGRKWVRRLDPAYEMTGGNDS